MLSCAAPADDQVGARDELRGQRRGEAAGHVEVPGAASEQPLGDGGRRQQRTAASGQLLAAPRGTRVRATRVRPRTPGGARPAAPRPAGAPRPGRAPPASGAAPGDGVPGRRRQGLHVERQVEDDDRAARRRRSRRPRRPARPRRPPTSTRIGTAPTAVASAAWSTKKFDRGDVASAASTTSGVRLFAASVIPVMAFVNPQPWCTLSAATPPLIRAYASAMVAAPPRAAPRRTAPRRRPSHWSPAKLPEPTTPKTASIPQPTSTPPTASATCRRPGSSAFDEREHPRRGSGAGRRSAAEPRRSSLLSAAARRGSAAG